MRQVDDVEVLLVEDSPQDAEMTMRSLRKERVVNSIEWVRDGVAALEFLFREGEHAGRPNGAPRVVLLDLKMPRMDGLETLRRIRADQRTRTLPVVILTSSREERDLIESYDLGVNSYIVKPVDFRQFAASIAQLGLYWVVANQVPQPGKGGL